MATSQARTHSQHLKDTKLKTAKPDVYKQFSQGLGTAFDAYETAAFKKIPKKSDPNKAGALVATEKAKILHIWRNTARSLRRRISSMNSR